MRWIVRTLEEAGYETWAVGGAVRDALAGRPTGDWDLATRATPDRMRRLFRRTVPIGVEHGTVGVLARDGTLYEVTTFRRDVETTGRHAVVSFAESLDEDLARRDFTINAVAWHPLRDEVRDPHGGVADLERHILRTVGDPDARFAEDYLRILRALRFAGHFGLEIDGPTWTALCAAVPHMGLLSPERIREELEKVLSGTPRASRTLALYAESGVLGFLLPELEATIGDGGWERALRAVDLLPRQAGDLRLGALLHGVGGGDARRTELGAASILTRLRFSNVRIRTVGEWAGLVADPPKPGDPPVALRRWLARGGRGPAQGALRILAARMRAEAAALAEGARAEAIRTGARLLRALRNELRSGAPLAVEELAVSGRDLIRMGYRPGPAFGEVLRVLLDRVLEDPSANDPDALAAEAGRLLDTRGNPDG